MHCLLYIALCTKQPSASNSHQCTARCSHCTLPIHTALHTLLCNQWIALCKKHIAQSTLPSATNSHALYCTRLKSNSHLVSSYQHCMIGTVERYFCWIQNDCMGMCSMAVKFGDDASSSRSWVSLFNHGVISLAEMKSNGGGIWSSLVEEVVLATPSRWGQGPVGCCNGLDTCTHHLKTLTTFNTHTTQSSTHFTVKYTLNSTFHYLTCANSTLDTAAHTTISKHSPPLTNDTGTTLHILLTPHHFAMEHSATIQCHVTLCAWTAIQFK